MKKKAPGNEQEVQDLVLRGMEGKEEDSRPLRSYRHGDQQTEMGAQGAQREGGRIEAPCSKLRGIFDRRER